MYQLVFNKNHRHKKGQTWKFELHVQTLCYCILFVFFLPGYWVAYKKLNKTLSSNSNHQESLHILDLCLHQLKSNNGKRQLKSEDFLYNKDTNLVFLMIANSFILLVNFYGIMILKELEGGTQNILQIE